MVKLSCLRFLNRRAGAVLAGDGARVGVVIGGLGVLFWQAALGEISGVATTLMIVGAAIGPVPLGVARDVSGSYNLALTLLALIPLALGIASLGWLGRGD